MTWAAVFVVAALLAGSPCGESAPLLVSGASYSQCVELSLAADVTGRPPLVVEWVVSSSLVLQGADVVLDTRSLSPGLHPIRVRAENSAGVSESVVYLGIEELRWTAGIEWAAIGDNEVVVRALAKGATEIRWIWGDGTSTGWQSWCAGEVQQHRFAVAGSYVVRAEIRTCVTGPLATTSDVAVQAGGPPRITRFEPVCGSDLGSCEIQTGEAVDFVLLVEGTVSGAAYLYDWNGDGVDDQVASAPITSHRYLAAGLYWPRVTVLSGSLSDQARTPLPIAVFGQSARDIIFEDGFESGLTGWRVIEDG